MSGRNSSNTRGGSRRRDEDDYDDDLENKLNNNNQPSEMMEQQQQQQPEEQENEEEQDKMNSVIELIIRIITQEKYCPDLILYQQEVVDDLFELLQNQEMSIKENEKNISEDKRLQIAKNKFLVDLHKEETERVKYLIKLYLRTRLCKIQKYHMNIMKYNKFEYLNISEREYVKNYSALRQQMFSGHLLGKLPQNFRNSGIEPEDTESQQNSAVQSHEKIQIDTPNIDKAVFVKFKTSGKYDIDSEQVQIEEGEIILVPYKHIKALHEKLEVELV